MADIEVVIEIEDKLYNRIKYLEPKADTMLDKLIRSVQNGTPLPKGHGRIGDLDALREEVSSWGMNDYEPSDFIDLIDQADTIIEADREQGEKMKEEKPYIVETITMQKKKYNPNYGDNRMCVCGHTYYRHFDPWDDMEAVGCKYCGCEEFIEADREVER